MPLFIAEREIDSLNTYLSAHFTSTPSVETICAVLERMVADKLDHDLRSRFDQLSVPDLQALISALRSHGLPVKPPSAPAVPQSAVASPEPDKRFLDAVQSGVSEALPEPSAQNFSDPVSERPLSDLVPQKPRSRPRGKKS